MFEIPYQKGLITRQAHVDIPEGTVEEEYARQGFFGGYAHLFRTRPPVEWTRIEGPLRPQAFDANRLPMMDAHADQPRDYLDSRTLMLFNEDVRLHLACFNRPMAYAFRNADADEALFVDRGTGVIETDFGPLSYEPGDYLIIPRGTAYRLNPNGTTRLLIFESFSELKLPDKGLLGKHALFDPAVVRVPTPSLERMRQPGESGELELRIQRRGEITRVFYPFDPLNTVGWKGTLTVWQINVRDIRPVTSERYHLPPSAHTTFLGSGFVICTFLPRPLETGDPGAMRIPFYHSNIDFDEVIYYHSGDFFSREGIAPGMLTFHPQGIHHGPQPEAVEKAKTRERTTEIAVMLDTRRPLEVASALNEVELQNYWKSWRPK